MTKLAGCMIGDANVGKTTFVERVQFNTFDSTRRPTTAMDTAKLERTVDGKTFNLTIYDTAGQEVYRSMPPIFLHLSDFTILCFDIRDDKLDDHLKEWVTMVDNEQKQQSQLFLVATKCDTWDAETEALFRVKAKQLKNDYRASDVFKTSSKTGENVQSTIDAILRSATAPKGEYRSPIPAAPKSRCCS